MPADSPSPIHNRIGAVFVHVTDMQRAIAWYSALVAARGLPPGSIAAVVAGEHARVPMDGPTGLTPRTGSGDLGHGTACPRSPVGVPDPGDRGPGIGPGRGDRCRSHGGHDEAPNHRCPPVRARRVRTVAARACGRWLGVCKVA